MRAVFTGGGTGGHIYPALSVAQRFQERHDAEISYIGSSKGMEKEIIIKAEIPFSEIKVDGFRSKNPFANFRVLLILISAIKESKKILNEKKPDFVFATGGYVSAPVAIAAKILKIPLFIHEQNSIPGLTNRLTSRFARIVFTTFENTSSIFGRNVKVVYSGLPVRSNFYKLDKVKAYKDFSLDPHKKTILITGGSRGARFLNFAVVSLYKFIIENDLQIIHITGDRDYPEVLETSKDIIGDYDAIKIYPYLNNMYDAINIADLCISRAGAAFLSEMTFLGKPGLIVPFPYATHNHQLENAKSLEKKGAVIVLEEKFIEKDPEILRKKIEELILDEQKLKDMENSSGKLGVSNTLEIIEENILKEIGVEY